MREVPGTLHRLFGSLRTVRLAAPSPAAYLFTLLLLIPPATLAQSNAEWTQYKIKCGIPASTAYNDWVAQGSPCPKTAAGASSSAPAAPALNSQQQLAMQGAAMGGYMIGQGLHQLLFGPPKTTPIPAPPDPAQQQRQIAAQQLNNSGIYLLKQGNYTGAINEFQKALANTPNDSIIAANLAVAKQKLKERAVASQTSGALGQVLGGAPANPGNFNFDQLTHSSVAVPNASALSLVNLGSDSSVVDLSGTARTSVDPAVLKGQLDAGLTNIRPASAPPDPRLVLPEPHDIELLFPGEPQGKLQLPQPEDIELLFPGEPSKPLELPRPEDIELLFPGLQSGPVVLPQPQDMELLGQPPKATKPPQKKTLVLPHN